MNNSPKSSNSRKVNKKDNSSVPLAMEIETPRKLKSDSKNDNHRLTPVKVNLKRLNVSNFNSPNTNKSRNLSNDFNSGSKSLSVDIEPIETSLFNEKLSRSSPKSPKRPTSKLLEPCTPQVQIQFSQELKKVLNERNVLTSKTRKHVFDALDELRNKDEEESRSYKKKKALSEIIESEKNYVHQLETIINYFLKPTQEKKLLLNEDFQTVFGNISCIYNINKELLEELEKNSNIISQAFSRIGPFLKVYSVYARDFKNILKVLQNAKSLNPQFAKFVENQESRPEVQNKLSALLITPIQRVPRYKLLLTQLLELTKPAEEDFASLKDCVERIEEVAEHINKNVEDQENMQRLLELQRFLKSGEPNIVKPGRTFIKDGILNKMATKHNPSEKLYTVLMNDIILFGKIKKELKVNSVKCLGIFPLGKCKVLEILDKGCLKIICQNEELILYHEQLSETRVWIEKIKESIENHITDRKTLRKDSSSRRPVKRKDLIEYHEVGLSPGRPLKKRKLASENIEVGINKFTIKGRKPINRTPVDFTKINKSISSTSTELHNLRSSLGSSTVIEPQQTIPSVSNEVFVFGRPHPEEQGFSFGKILGGVGSTIKKLFRFK